MDQQKFNFITKEYIPLLKNLPGDAVGKWGKMNGQQMAEHVAAFFYVSTEKIKFDLVTPLEHLPKYKEFLLSDKEFRENTKAPSALVPEEPVPLKHATMPLALQELQDELDYFFKYFDEHPGIKTMHPAFGELNFEEWIQGHYKHVMHHLKQFELL